jgi:hypothetical protein
MRKERIIKPVIYTFLLVLIVTCTSKKQKMQDSINEAWTLLDNAFHQPETDLGAPMGFILNCTNSEFYSHCEELISKYGGRQDENVIYIKTKDFGGVEREVRMSKINYFSDPNTETEYVAEIGFIFDEFRDDSSSNGGWQVLCDSISKKFDSSWETVDFNLKDVDERESLSDISTKFYKYWVRGNIAVEFYYHGFHDYATLTYYNVPKNGTHFLREKVKRTLEIKNETRQKIQKKNSTIIDNSAWDGSVWQVKNYLKKNLNDPKSYEGIDWSKVIETGDTYKVKHKYRAKNAFGGYVVVEQIFTLDDEGNVINVQ